MRYWKEILALAAFIVFIIVRGSHVPKSVKLVDHCHCGAICNDHMHCGLDDCPHGH